jgi:hypothetical protein
MSECQRPGCGLPAVRKYCCQTCAGLDRARTDPGHFSAMGEKGGMSGHKHRSRPGYRAGYQAGYNAGVRDRSKHGQDTAS